VTPRIPLAADLVPLVLSGKKTSTVRLGKRNYPLGPANIVSTNFDVPIEITAIEFSRIGHLDEDVAKTEGYESVAELLGALRRFYPNANKDHDVTILRFRKS
jgi:hypothetical protein